MDVFHFVTINLLPLTLSTLQCVLFYVYFVVYFTEMKTQNETFMNYKLSDSVYLGYLD